MVATSVPSERLFSKSGQIMTDSRNRLTGEHLNKLLFLGSLSENDWNLDKSKQIIKFKNFKFYMKIVNLFFF